MPWVSPCLLCGGRALPSSSEGSDSWACVWPDMYFFLALFRLHVLFLSSVQSEWPLWIEGRADSAEKVDWWLIVQPDSARPNWLGGDPVLAPRPLIFVFFYSGSLFFFPPRSARISPSTSHTFRHAQCINIHVRADYTHTHTHTSSSCFFLPPPPPPPVVFAALNSSLLPSFILGRFLSSFLCPLCFLCQCSFRTGFVPWVIPSGFTLQPLIIRVRNARHFQEMHQRGFWFCHSFFFRNFPVINRFKIRG